jgi:hypothetical protein
MNSDPWNVDIENVSNGPIDSMRYYNNTQLKQFDKQHCSDGKVRSDAIARQSAAALHQPIKHINCAGWQP